VPVSRMLASVAGVHGRLWRVGVPVLWGALAIVAGGCAQEAGVLAPAQASGCKLQIRPAVRIEVPASRWPNVADHIADVDQRYPRILHVDRGGADANRAEALRGYPTDPDRDRDEYPPAVSREGGEGAHVRYVDDSENQSQGASMGYSLRPYCDGSHFRLVPVP
jgi:hypothetical protein